MFEAIALALLATGTALAGIWDLRTTEVPDEIPALLISSGIFIWYVYALTVGNFAPLFFSLALGTGTLLAGWFMYRKGYWGGADAFMLASVAFMLPVYRNALFLPAYALNFLVVSSAYMVLYALALGILHPEAFSYLLDDLRNHGKVLAGAALAAAVLLGAAVLFVRVPAPGALAALLGAVAFTLFWRYAKVIEQRIFRRKIPASHIRAGDVLETMIWRGITAAEIKDLAKKRKFVVIKEGVRFVPVFFITLLVTVFYGNIFLLLMGLQ